MGGNALGVQRNRNRKDLHPFTEFGDAFMCREWDVSLQL